MRVLRLSRNLFTSRRDDLGAVCVPNRNCIDRAGVAGAQQSLALDRVGLHEHCGAALVEHEGFGSLRDAVAEADAQCAIDPHAQLSDGALFEIAHIPSSPNSARAVSMMAGAMPAPTSHPARDATGFVPTPASETPAPNQRRPILSIRRRPYSLQCREAPTRGRPRRAWHGGLRRGTRGSGWSR